MEHSINLRIRIFQKATQKSLARNIQNANIGDNY